MRLLIVEDETLLREQLASTLGVDGYAIDQASDGREGLYLGTEYDYDLAVIDLGLPELDGVSLIKALRLADRNFPIIILTARDQWQDKVEGLEAGGDDYLTKPFHPQELKARINALLRRAAGHASSEINYGQLVLDTRAKTVSRNGAVAELTSFEYNTFEYMALNPNKVVSKVTLTEHLYDQDFDRDSNVIEVFMMRLRKKIDPENTLKPITALRGQGYRFELKPV